MQFEGDREFPLPPESLWGKLSDARFLVGCLSNAEGVVVRDSTHAEWKMKPGLSFVAGTIDTKLAIVEAQSPTHIALELTSKGIGSGSVTEVRLTLKPHETGTQVHWVGQIKELTGLLKMVPKGLIQSTATKVITDIWTGVEKTLASA